MGSDDAAQDAQQRAGISIHAPRVGSDKPGTTFTPSVSISIHAPRVGSDIVREDFFCADGAFQSTLPVWGAT